MRSFLVGVAVSVFLTSPCHAGSIGLYTNPDGTGCSLTLGAMESAKVYVVALTDSSDPYGGVVDSGEFRIVGLPGSWIAMATPDAAITVSIGDPFADGVISTWPTVQARPL